MPCEQQNSRAFKALCSKRAMIAAFSSLHLMVGGMHRASPPQAAVKVETEGVRSDGFRWWAV